MAVQTRIGVEHANTPKATASATVRDIAWAAGFLEGEASFSANRQPNGRRYARIEAFQNHLEPLQMLQRIFGGSITPRKRQRPEQRGGWYWLASGPRARGVLMTIYSFMSPRRRAEMRVSLAPEVA